MIEEKNKIAKQMTSKRQFDKVYYYVLLTYIDFPIKASREIKIRLNEICAKGG